SFAGASGPDEPNVEKRPTANARAATATAMSTGTSHRRAREGRSWDVILASRDLARAVQRAGARGVRLGRVLVAPVLLEELLDALVIRGVDLQLRVPRAEGDRRVEALVGREDHVARGELALERVELVVAERVGVVRHPHGAVFERVHGVLVGLRLGVDA